MCANVALEDRDVPEAHRGLHDTLYGMGAEQEHSGGDDAGAIAHLLMRTAGRSVQPVQNVLDVFQTPDGVAPKVAAVYGIYNYEEELVYVGVTRNIAMALRAHVEILGRSKVHSVKVKTFTFPRKADMEKVKSDWIVDNGKVPEGNHLDKHGKHNTLWSDSVSSFKNVAERAMTSAERHAFEEKKFKLRKAMADSTLAQELDAANNAVDSGDNSSLDKLRQQNIQFAVEGDDWSGEINAQTAATVRSDVTISEADVPRAKPLASSETKVSPFLDESTFSGEYHVNPQNVAATDGAGPVLDLTVKNVDSVLDEVRPYLISDGGDVSVVAVDPVATGTNTKVVADDSALLQRFVVTLQLEGACGTCPSSTTTMKLGVERVLRERFGEAIADVIAVSDPAAALKAELSIELCEKALDDVRATVTGFGGAVTTLSASAGCIRLKYHGPPTLKYGIELMLRDKVPNVQTVEWV